MSHEPNETSQIVAELAQIKEQISQLPSQLLSADSQTPILQSLSHLQ
ncbi:MAG: hypothetical protein MET45_15245 [Nostoc sp. LLA-1]|nr:hypothetical protein [Cyanocohniella sp. LLY]